MDIHKPNAVHNWREFVGEIGIIVIGVLIALAGEQVVESVHIHHRSDQYRTAAHRELAFNLAAFEYRIAQAPCVQRRVNELNEWRADWQNGSGEPLHNDILRPSIVMMRASVREPAPSDVLTDMSVEERSRIAALYDSLDVNQQLIHDERDAWRSLGGFSHATALTHDDLMRLDELIYRVSSIDHTLTQNVSTIHRQAEQLGVQADFGDDRPNIAKPDVMFCRDLLEHVPS